MGYKQTENFLHFVCQAHSLNLRAMCRKRQKNGFIFCFWLRCGTRETFSSNPFRFSRCQQITFQRYFFRHATSYWKTRREHISLHLFSHDAATLSSLQRNPIKSIENQVSSLLLCYIGHDNLFHTGDSTAKAKDLRNHLLFFESCEINHRARLKAENGDLLSLLIAIMVSLGNQFLDCF